MYRQYHTRHVALLSNFFRRIHFFRVQYAEEHSIFNLYYGMGVPAGNVQQREKKVIIGTGSCILSSAVDLFVLRIHYVE